MKQTLALFAGKYQILQDIGAGGMGVVHLALDVRLNRQVAIKCLQSHVKDVARFKQEAALLAQLNHPHIVQLFDYIDETSGADGEQELALVMEYVSGKTLSATLNEGLYTQRQAIIWLAEISDALAAAQQKNIIHRDLKPENILISDAARVKITDFGIARSAHDPRTRDSRLMGSYSALAPEQVANGELSSKTDLFALGLLAYQLFCARHPFGHTDAPAELIHNTCYSEPIPPRDLVEDLPASLNDLILALLQKPPELRPASAAHVGETLRQLIPKMADAPVVINPTVVLPKPSAKDKSIYTPYPTGPTRKPRAFLAAMLKPHYFLVLGLVLSAMALVGWRWSVNTVALPLYVAVLPPALANVDAKSQEQYTHVLMTLKSGIEHAVIQGKAYELIPQRELLNLDKDIALIGKAIGADVLFQTLVTCLQKRCEVELSRIDKEDWSVRDKASWPLLIDDGFNNFQMAQRYSSSLLGMCEQSVFARIDEETYRQFVDLESQAEQQPAEFKQQLTRCKLLLGKAPTFFPLYRLYVNLNTKAYDQTRDVAYINAAAEIFNQAKKIFPDQHEVYVVLADLAFAMGDLDDTKSKLLALRSMQAPQDLLLFIQAKIASQEGRNSDALAHLEKAIALRPRSLYYKWLALTQWRLGDYHRAGSTIASLRALSPDDEYALGMVASIAMFEGQLDAAIEAYTQLVSLHGTAQNYSDLGLAYLIKQNFSEAQRNFSLALQGGNDHATYILNIADAEKSMGKMEQAMASYRRVVALESSVQMDSIEGKLSLAQAYAHLQDAKNAIATMQGLLEHYSENANVLYTASLVYSLVGEHQSALVFFERTLDKGMGIAWFQLPWFEELCRFPSFKEKSLGWGESALCRE